MSLVVVRGRHLAPVLLGAFGIDLVRAKRVEVIASLGAVAIVG